MLHKKRDDEEATEPNVLPVMNIMFLMIPALLLAMEVAKMAAVTVSPPNIAMNPSQEKPPETPPEKRLEFKVFILEDGFRISTADQQAGPGPSIALAKPGAPMSDYERYDYAALEAKAKELKQKAAHETVVTLSAENHVSMQVLLSAMDAVRGSDCKLLMLEAGAPMPDECLFIQPVVEAGAS
jgi:biopolymer transport protein ExbD